ncbi:hypothetical protein CRM22_001419 [Opisthorchis felineus]|uniref:Uncharacterized protein n=1 Tax=Opisthorchis felineus TaxID=147828 RepID=A0A4S2MAR0_OPIFE|nr:hypothetical protein CRM22_001419 [Opisthorchis felineus]
MDQSEPWQLKPVLVVLLPLADCAGMAGGAQVPNETFTGWRYWFNTVTVRGRANIVYATYATCFISVLALRRRFKKKAALDLEKEHAN